MSLPTYTGATNYVAALDDLPNDTGGLTAAQLKAVFDQFGTEFVAWLNGTYTPAVAPLASPTFTGTPAAPTAAVGTDTTQLATTAFVRAAALIPMSAVSASATLALADANKQLNCSSASTITLTVPPNSSVAFLVGTVIIIERDGAGAVTMAAGAGVTINSADSKLSISKQFKQAALVKTATDTWSLLGDLS